MNFKIAAVIVSFNRKDFVLKNIDALSKLSFKNISIILYDNGSTDGTIDAVRNLFPTITVIQSSTNLGGAGGFAKAMEYAYNNNFEYIWCLDDDGCPDKDCLKVLLEESAKCGKHAIFGPRIIPSEDYNKEKHIWPIIGKYDSEKKQIVEFSSYEKDELISSNETFETASVALVGMFVHREVIDIIGYPNLLFFIAGDDVEYCLRAWKNNVKVLLVQRAILYHPVNKKRINFLFKEMEIMVSPPWKLYYMIRNNIYLSKIYFTKYLVVKLCIVHLYIMFYLLFTEKNKKQILKSTFVGLFHGFTNKLGKYDLN